MKVKNFLLPLLAAFSAAAAEVSVTPSGISVTPGSSIVSWKKAALIPYMTIGPKGVPEKLQFASGKAQTKDLTWSVAVVKKGRFAELDSEIRNLSDRELWIEPEWRLKTDGKFLRFWDGFNTVKPVGKAPLLRRTTKSKFEKNVGASMMPFPISAVFSGKDGVFLGGGLFDAVSFHASCFYPETNELAFSYRFVLAPQSKVQFRQFLGECRTAFGEREGAVQEYYESLPELWQVVRGQDNPYIWGNYSHYQSWWLKPDAEMMRRRYSSIDWCYCPYRRSGDIYGYDELSDYPMFSKPRNIPKMGGTMVDAGKLDNAAYRKLRHELFAKYARDFGWMFYNSCGGIWCEITLAQKRFPDSINDDPDVPQVLTVWSTAYDKEIRTFPYGTSYQKFFEDSVRDTVKELPFLPGFAFDCGYGGAFYRGPAVEKDIPGRAWDEKGKFIEQAVAINRQIDVVHSLRDNEGNPLTAWVNGYLKGDRNELEATYRNHGRFMRNMPLWRFWIGPKPVNQGGPFSFELLFPDWRNMTPEDLREALSKVADHTLLSAFQYGMFYDFVCMDGNPKLYYAMPELIECSRAGWQATVPFSTDLRVPFKGRFGRGVQTIFTFGNSSPHALAGEICADNSYLSVDNWNYIFLRHSRGNSATKNEIKDGKTVFSVELPSRSPELYRAVAGVQCPQGTKVQVSAERTLDKRSFTLTFDGPAFESPVRLREQRGFYLKQILLDGKKVSTSAKLKFNAGSKLELVYLSKNFRAPAFALHSFFAACKAKKEANFKIYTTAENEKQAKRIVEYFDFCRRKGVFRKDAALPQVVVTPKPLLEKGALTLWNDPKVSGAGRQSGGFVIWSANPKQLDNILTELFHVMDRQFPYVPPFASTMGLPCEGLVHAGLLQKSIPFTPFWGEYK